ncbi:MAG: phage tail sheath subtilisin-like domain-containing protein [Caldilineaceae bacterium]
MAEILSPGVYIQEVSGGPKPIEAASTSTALFLGYTQKAQQKRIIDEKEVLEDVLGKPIFLTSWRQYMEIYGDLVPGVYLPQSIYGFFQNGGRRCYVISLATIPQAKAELISGDGKKYFVIETNQPTLDTRLRVKIEPPKLLTGPTNSSSNPAASSTPKDGASSDPGNSANNPPPATNTPPSPTPQNAEDSMYKLIVEREVKPNSDVWKELEMRRFEVAEQKDANGAKLQLQYFNKNEPKFVKLSLSDSANNVALDKVYPKPDKYPLTIVQGAVPVLSMNDYQGNALQRTGLDGTDEIDDISTIATPDLMVMPPGKPLDGERKKEIKAIQTMMIDHCKNRGDRVFIVDTPPNLTAQDAARWRMFEAGYDSSYAAVYYPWIEIWDRTINRSRCIPPSGYMAGIWARNDTQRGVHKAPANEIVNDAIGLAVNVTMGEQDILNPIGVNCIRAFPGMGIRVWGARTMSLSDPEWRYLNVRRLFNMIEKSIQRATMWAVFEPNDWRLWSKLRRDVGNFLMGLYSQGMLFGRTAGEAFFVQVDETNNPSYSRDLGFLYVDVGISPVKPAEFIVFRIRQWSGEPPAQG